jgi:hypothetical protein
MCVLKIGNRLAGEARPTAKHTTTMQKLCMSGDLTHLERDIETLVKAVA